MSRLLPFLAIIAVTVAACPWPHAQTATPTVSTVAVTFYAGTCMEDEEIRTSWQREREISVRPNF